jgi:hypothetical protein
MRRDVCGNGALPCWPVQLPRRRCSAILSDNSTLLLLLQLHRPAARVRNVAYADAALIALQSRILQKGICLGLYVVRRHTKSIKHLLACTDGIYPHRELFGTHDLTPCTSGPFIGGIRSARTTCEASERPVFRSENMARMWPLRHNVVRQAMNIGDRQNKKAPRMTACTAPSCSQFCSKARL